ncbi:hypothetical protein [Amphritea balenae]|nr:hypothetical protein [Amphritea balenae]GGK75938.1 hypothetical protein GCM10007941_27630 [Amphritea balenae]
MLIVGEVILLHEDLAWLSDDVLHYPGLILSANVISDTKSYLSSHANSR